MDRTPYRVRRQWKVCIPFELDSAGLNCADSVAALRDTVWKMDENLLLPPKSNPNAYSDVIGSITRKRLTGAPVSNVDACAFNHFASRLSDN